MGFSHGACFYCYWRVPCRDGRSCAPAPGRLFAARQRKFCQRRLAARGQVDSTGPRAIIQRSQLYLLRQRWLPCAKGAVGERRLKDWQRGHPACPARERSMGAAARRFPGLFRPPGGVPAGAKCHRIAMAVVLAQAKMAPLCKGGTAWQGHAGGIVKPHCIQPAFSTARRQDCRAAFPGVGSPAPE